ALHWPLHKPAALGGLAIATAYSLVAGWSVPTQRTLVMLAVVVLAQCSERRFPPLQILLLALLVVLLYSPLAVHASGFWLSFGAVGLLMLGGGLFRHLPAWRQALAVQLLLSLLLLPLTVWFFERASWVSPLANLLAVPLVSFVVVPLGLLGLLAWLCGATGAALLCWRGGADLIAVLDAMLEQFQAWSFASISVGLPDLLSLLLLCLLLFCLCQPLRRAWCWLALPLACFLLWPRPTVPAGVLRVTVLDVGQGLSVLLETREHSLLYDSGPVLGPAADAGGRIVLPALHQLHRYRLDVLLLSHDDNDHTGGAASLLQQMPVARGLGVRPRGVTALPPWQPCADGQAWEWEGWTFRLLHPVAGEGAGSDNNRSCVLRVSRGRAAVLLPGDLEQSAEQDVLRRHAPADLQADLLVLGHHGSRNASAPDWLAALRPRWAIASAGYRNRFRHPSPALLQRLREAGIPWRNTAESGALVAELDAGGLLRLRGFREGAGRYWQHDEAQAFFCESTDTVGACGALGGTPLNR
ncbi:MAG TPA: DNA internalization-related competence protein ComEC/Rec2, partial [Moraxellaceae bacterium]